MIMRPNFSHPHAMTMWDFSWLERRWPGAGYEDWDNALGELAERGYDAVRIDAFPHLVATDPDREWELLPVWNQQNWGASSIVRVRVLPELTDFIASARRAGIKVSLSSWFREDRENTRVTFTTPEAFGRMWVETLRQIESAGLLDEILFVDLCNEFPLRIWAPWLYASTLAQRFSQRALDKRPIGGGHARRGEQDGGPPCGVDGRVDLGCPTGLSGTRLHLFVRHRADDVAESRRHSSRRPGAAYLDGEQ